MANDLQETAFYIPSSYTIYFNSSKDIASTVNFNNRVFFHEFLHYLQDLTLPYLFRYASITCVQLASLVHESKQRGQLRSPYGLWPDDYYVTAQQYAYTWGKGEFIKKFGVIIHHEKKIRTLNK
ncbi:hypothetical protein [Erwinia oleae]|uniref:hypothetical protein n=1 Tax=Erwinia oleae TaxID=796334 RepID=UPI000ABA1DE1|nr:hypothetical protein [Erwinia oleae]